MSVNEIRKKFFEFFEARGHAIVPSSSLIPDDPSVLLTTAGMQQFKKYYTGEADPMKDFGSKNTASIQKSFRTSDIDEVGDESHLTFFEMMGNFSFGGYGKKETIEYAHEFLTKEMGLTISYVTVFEGKEDIGVPKDEESIAIWKSIDPTIKIIEQGMDDVFWGPTGSEGPCGPTTEIYIENGAGEAIEIWNCVFNQYYFSGSREELNSGLSGKKLRPLEIFGVDTGMGFERLAMVAQKTPTIFDTDLFSTLITSFPDAFDERKKRIVADHARAIAFLISDGLRPSNKGAGYILRRLMRRIIAYGEWNARAVFEEVAAMYRGAYPELVQEVIVQVFTEEREKFERTLRAGLHELEHAETIDSKTAFRLYESFGLPFEVIKEAAKEKAAGLSREEFDQEFLRHQEVSRAGSVAKFGGHGLYLKTGELTVRDQSELEKVTRLHTATHLLHAALRAVLGDEVRQDGSDITVERTRLDFRFSRKVEKDELAKAEEWVNDAIKKDLSVKWEEMPYEKAAAEGALGFFQEKYGAMVKVYTVFDSKTGEVYSKELCGGPHVEHTGIIGNFRILKEESSSAGVRRIRAVVE